MTRFRRVGMSVMRGEEAVEEMYLNSYFSCNIEG